MRAVAPKQEYRPRHPDACEERDEERNANDADHLGWHRGEVTTPEACCSDAPRDDHGNDRSIGHQEAKTPGVVPQPVCELPEGEMGVFSFGHDQICEEPLTEHALFCVPLIWVNRRNPRSRRKARPLFRDRAFLLVGVE
jgi:hypothetical protein